jgi:hypothetical protein
MTVEQLRRALAREPDAGLHIMLPSGEFVPAHFHVTEVGKIRKDFIDCGGTVRSAATCAVQVWVANDTDHRLTAGKLAKIFDAADALLDDRTLPIEIEYETEVLGTYPLGDIEVTPAGLLFALGAKHTACLAPDRCGVAGCN